MGLKDRHGRKVEIVFSGQGLARRAGEAQFGAALRLRRELVTRAQGAGAAELCRAGVSRLLGLAPETAEVRLGSGRFLLNVPADLGGFLSDLHGIVLRDQYNAAGVKGGVVADCGANLGLFSLYASACGAKKVYAFEAVRETFCLLRKNLRLNGSPAGIIPLCAALGAEPGTAVLKFNTRGEGSAMIGGEDTVNAPVTYAGRRRVKIYPLDALLKGRLDFLKIDVEGCEKEVLLGAARLIKRCKPVLSFAAYHREADKAALPAVVKALAPGYRVRLNGYAEQDFYCVHR
jgi:FkbM family methyltransferase